MRVRKWVQLRVEGTCEVVELEERWTGRDDVCLVGDTERKSYEFEI